MTVHAYYDTKELDVYHVLLHKSFITSNREEASKMPGFLQFTEIEPFLRANATKKTFLSLTPVQLTSVRNELEFIEENGEYDTDELLPLRKHTAWKILYYLSYLLGKQSGNKQKISKNKYEYAIINTLEYIHGNYSERITVEQLCKMTYLSRSTFLRSFYDMCSCTPIAYPNKYRCQKATEMIDRAEVSKTEIAHKCGFYDLSHMERFLKKYI